MKHLYFPVAIRIVLGLVAGLIGGVVTRQVAMGVSGLPEGTATFAFWVVFTGGVYKGIASASSLLDDTKEA